MRVFSLLPWYLFTRVLSAICNFVRVFQRYTVPVLCTYYTCQKLVSATVIKIMKYCTMAFHVFFNSTDYAHMVIQCTKRMKTAFIKCNITDQELLTQIRDSCDKKMTHFCTGYRGVKSPTVKLHLSQHHTITFNVLWIQSTKSVMALYLLNSR